MRRGVRAKIEEELREIDEVPASDNEQRAEELGDLLFAVANWARHLQVDAEEALRLANAKFERRFRAMEELAAQRALALEGADRRRLGRAVERGENSGEIRLKAAFSKDSSTPPYSGATVEHPLDRLEAICRSAAKRWWWVWWPRRLASASAGAFAQDRYDRPNGYDQASRTTGSLRRPSRTMKALRRWLRLRTSRRRPAAGHAGPRQHAAARVLGRNPLRRAWLWQWPAAAQLRRAAPCSAP